jgi:hypothetical protein
MCLWSPSVCLFCCRNYVYPTWGYINSSQAHECGNWDWGCAIPRKGIHKWDFPCSVVLIPVLSVCSFLLLFLPNQIVQNLTKHVQTAARKEDVSSSKLWTDEIFWAMPFSGFPASITELYCMTWWAGPRALLWNPRGASLSSYKLFSNQVCQEWKDRAP